MALEIERRFLVAGEGWRAHASSPQDLAQGYLTAAPQGPTLRVRRAVSADAPASAQGAWLTLKLPSAGIARHEFEYPIPVADAQELLGHCLAVLSKRRHRLDLPGGDWVLDVFEAANAPLVIAEVELERADSPVEPPPWCVCELTGDGRFSNAALAHQPFAHWPEAEREAVLQLLASAAGAGG